ncbi:MAG: hypothetical protein RLY97_872 [Pseudomonadota bacterium]
MAGVALADFSEVNANQAEIAGAFVAARHAGVALSAYPGDRPLDMCAAYQIQDLAIALDGRSVGAWKVGRIGPAAAEQLGADRLVGPCFTANIVPIATGDAVAMPIFPGGFAAVEAELMLHVAAGGRGVPPVDNAQAKLMIDEVRLGIEVAGSPYAAINDDGATVIASDFGNNGGIVLGARLEGWQDMDLNAIQVRMEIDGAEVGVGSAATMLDGPYGAVRFLLGNLSQRGIDWSGGLWVSTGAITGVHALGVGQRARAIFDDLGVVSCRTIAAGPL